MKLSKLGDLRLTYTELESLDHGSGGQLYGRMEGRLEGERLSGSLRLTNLAARRADDVNLPTLRGVLRTDDVAAVWVEMDGLATLRPSDQARVFVTTMRFRAGDARYRWLDTVFCLVEGVLDRVATGGTAHGEVHACEATVT